MKATIGILGGSFDPIHQGHEELALIALRHLPEVWIMPCYQHSHNKALTPADHRLNMARIIASKHAHQGMYVSDFEIYRQTSGSTYQTMLKLTQLLHEYDFTYIIGQDCADAITSWKSYKSLINEFKFMVVPRKGYPLNNDPNVWYNADKKHKYLREDVLAMGILEVSSTQIRQMLKSGSRPKMIDSKVYEYICDCELYGISEAT